MIPSMMTEELQIPAMADGFKNVNTRDLQNYSVRYIKADLDALSDITALQEIETRGIRGDDVLILNRDKYTFLERYFLVVQYLERNN